MYVISFVVIYSILSYNTFYSYQLTGSLDVNIPSSR